MSLVKVDVVIVGCGLPAEYWPRSLPPTTRKEGLYVITKS